MQSTTIEHVNLTVSDPDASAVLLCAIFDWHVRWSGASLQGGRTVHVGTGEQYLALYTPPSPPHAPPGGSYATTGCLNHVGVLVGDIDACEERVREAGFTPGMHSDYHVGRRFYFHDADGIEFEVVSRNYAVQDVPG